MTKAFEKHNHQSCQQAIWQGVDARAELEGLKLTPMRRRVLAILLESHEALGAYDILNRLVAEGEAAQPPIVYRALAFLTEHGFAHKVESQNAYIACSFPQEAHQAALMICRNCKSVGEASLPEQVLAGQDFHIESEVVEAEGLCSKCYEVEIGSHSRG